MNTHIQTLTELLPHESMIIDSKETDLGYYEVRARYPGAPAVSQDPLHLYEIDKLTSAKCVEATSLARIMDAQGIIFVAKDIEQTVEETLRSLSILDALPQIYLLRRVNFTESQNQETIVLHLSFVRVESRPKKGRPSKRRNAIAHQSGKARERLYNQAELGHLLGITRAGASKYFRQRGWPSEVTQGEVDTLLTDKIKAIHRRFARMKLSSPPNIPEDLSFLRRDKVLARPDLYVLEKEALQALKQQKRFGELGKMTVTGFTLSSHGPVLVFARKEIAVG